MYGKFFPYLTNLPQCVDAGAKSYRELAVGADWKWFPSMREVMSLCTMRYYARTDPRGAEIHKSLRLRSGHSGLVGRNPPL